MKRIKAAAKVVTVAVFERHFIGDLLHSRRNGGNYSWFETTGRLLFRRVVPAAVALIAFAGFAFYASAAPAATSTRDGVYTGAQAKQGKAIYTAKCAECHGADLSGSDQNPPLKGEEFMTRWKAMPLSDLFEVTHATMPATAPGSLSPDETIEVISYILEANKMPAGKTPLPPDPAKLKAIQIDTPTSAE